MADNKYLKNRVLRLHVLSWDKKRRA